MSTRLDLYLPDARNPARRQALADYRVPARLHDHREAAKAYVADEALSEAVNIAVAVGAPLLLTGEPGTGKTQLAHHLARYYGVELHLLVRTQHHHRR